MTCASITITITAWTIAAIMVAALAYTVWRRDQ